MSDESTAESPIKSVFDAGKQRLSHPVTGVFVIVWLLSNWRPIFYLIVDDSNAASRMLVASKYANWWTMLIIPALATVAYLLASPWLKYSVFLYNEKVRKKEADKIYNGKLEEIQRNIDLQQTSLASQEKRIEDRQLEFARLRKNINELKLQRERLTQAIQDTLNLTANTLPKAGTLNSPTRKQLIDKISKIEELKVQLLEVEKNNPLGLQ